MSKSHRILSDVKGKLGGYGASMETAAHAIVRAAGRELGLGARHEVSLLLCDNATIRRLNRRWRSIDRATDVLAFPLHEIRRGSIPPAGALGDIVVSLPMTRSEARREGVAATRHLARLLIHGLLHLLGYDHMTAAEARFMQREEDRLLARSPES